MKSLDTVRAGVLVLLCLATASAQQPQQNFDPDEVVAVIGGEEYTADDVEKIRARLPAQFKQRADLMDHRNFLRSFAELKAMAAMAEKEGVLEQEPFKSQLEYNKMIFLAQVYLTLLNSSMTVTPEELEQYYNDHIEEFEDVRVSAIYIDYAPIPELAGKQDDPDVVSEQEAWAKAEQIAAQLRSGADFAGLARKHSDDADSAEKGGDVGFFSRNSKISDKLKQVIFSLQPGEISDAVKDGGRFYIFQCTERKAKAYEEVAQEIAQRVQAEKLRKKLDEVRASLPIEFKNDAFLDQRPGNPNPPSGAAAR